MNKLKDHRYARQLALPQIGEEGQEKLSRARVLVVGVGGLGSPALFYLAAAGVGHIGMVDFDIVSESNLNRQILHSTDDMQRLKTDSAREKLQALNPEIEIEAFSERFTSSLAEEQLARFDMVIDASDNFQTKYLVNDICCRSGTPFVHGGIRAFTGQLMTVLPGESACYRCVFEEREELVHELGTPIGPLGVVSGVIGTLQAAEALKFITGFGALLTNRLLIYDAACAAFREVPVHRQQNCSLCSVGEK